MSCTMRGLLTILFVGILGVAMLPSCALVEPKALPVSEALPEPAKKAQLVINESYVTLIAASNTTFTYVQEGWMSKEEGRGYYNKLQDMKVHLVEAQTLLDGGLILNAETQAELIHRAVAAVHAEILKRKPAPEEAK